MYKYSPGKQSCREREMKKLSRVQKLRLIEEYEKADP